MKTRVIELSVNNRKEVIELPINPPSVEFTEKQLKHRRSQSEGRARA